VQCEKTIYCSTGFRTRVGGEQERPEKVEREERGKGEEKLEERGAMAKNRGNG
jgi:hypothetical protein